MRAAINAKLLGCLWWACLAICGQAFSPYQRITGPTRANLVSSSFPIQKRRGFAAGRPSHARDFNCIQRPLQLSVSSIGGPCLGILSWIAKLGRVRLAACFLALLAMTLLYRNRMKLLWPGATADPHFSEPLPPGTLGCPLLGINLLRGSRKLGPEFVIREASKSIGDPKIWKSYFMGRPVVMISGSELVKKVNNMEFDQTTSRSLRTIQKLEKEGYKEKPKVFGNNNLMFERDKDQHSFLRRLVGAAMTPQALKGALPTIQETAAEVIEREVLQVSNNNHTVKMEDVCVDYTMDIVQKQLLGLQLPATEVAMFRDKLKVWLKAMYSFLNMLNITWLIKRSPPYKAKQYIVAKLEEKVDSLLANGPDTSTLSNMVFATDEEFGSKRLSREAVIENAQLLVIAGSETSAGTLTLAMLLLGLHPEKYKKLVQEQLQVVEKHGTNLTQAILDKQCPYLEAVVKETLRMGPVTAGFPKTAKETIVLDGVQIPKNWAIMTNYRLSHQLDPVTDGTMDPYSGFQPERWFHSDTIPTEWMPFGAGPRFCLGYHLSMMEMKVFLAMLARRVTSFDLVNYSPGQGTISWNPSTMIPRPDDGVLVGSLVVADSSDPSGLKEYGII